NQAPPLVRNEQQPIQFFGPVAATASRGSGEATTDGPGSTPSLIRSEISSGTSARVPSRMPLSELRYLGQILKCYLLLESPTGLVIVDMHAAHERVTFYRLKSQFLEGEVASQGLLIPDVIELESGERETLEERREELERLGFSFDAFGETAVIFRAVPALLASAPLRRLVEDVLSVPEWGSGSFRLDEAVDHVLARLACHGSIRSGRELERDEVYALLRSLEEAEASAFCPHGRPIVRTLAESELERMFGRTT
ncbi:MAG: hypothetical protein KDD44_02540, partial [Bdellovibrionales bacterium]|nr:hypothetical protein [Bdellovibrionales bacterium]